MHLRREHLTHLTLAPGWAHCALHPGSLGRPWSLVPTPAHPPASPGRNGAGRGAILLPCVAGSCLPPSSGAPGPPAEVTSPRAGPGWSGAAAGEVPRKLKLGREGRMMQGSRAGRPAGWGRHLPRACLYPLDTAWVLPRAGCGGKDPQDDCVRWTGSPQKPSTQVQPAGLCVGCGRPPPPPSCPLLPRR